MARPMGEREAGVLRLDFDRRLKLEFHGSKVTSDAGLLQYRELDDALRLTEITGDTLTDTRRGKNGRHGSCWAVPPVRFRTPWRLRRRERCRPAQSRPGDEVDRRRPCCYETGGLERRRLGQTRWELGGGDIKNDENWKRHKADLDARRNVAGFGYEMENNDGSMFCHLIEGKPVFADNGDFVGYKGVTIVSPIFENGPATNDGKALNNMAAGSGRSRKRRRNTAAS